VSRWGCGGPGRAKPVSPVGLGTGLVLVAVHSAVVAERDEPLGERVRRMSLAAMTAVAALGITTPPAHADELFTVCPSGTSGVATAVTSCRFAESVRRAWIARGVRRASWPTRL
jgi:hypothetical protein